jgi:hypothetical protein
LILPPQRRLAPQVPGFKNSSESLKEFPRIGDTPQLHHNCTLAIGPESAKSP